MSELLPCPFCGGEAAFGSGVNYSFVNCVECMGSTDTIMASGCQWTKQEAAKAWNTRAARLPDREGWLPIETAEKTGEIRLLRLKQNIPKLGFWRDGWFCSATRKPIEPEGWARLPAPYRS